MIDDATISQGSALRERRRVILLCAPVTLLFTFADTLALQRFSPLVFGLRLLWAALIVGVALGLGRVEDRIERLLVLGLAVGSSLFFGLITWLTGGFASPLFHWILAMPLVIAVVLQEFPRATLGAAIATLVSGIAIVLASGQGAAIAAQWAVQAFGMSALAVYASVTYRRLRFREQGLREAAAVAVERAQASEHEVKARDEFLSVAAHELRTPVASLVLTIERLARGSEPDQPTGRAVVAAAHRQVIGLTRLIETLLDVSRLNTGRLALDLGRAEIGAFIEQVVERYEPTAHKHGCLIVVDKRASAMVAIDRLRLEQVFSNLLANAVRHGCGKPIELVVSAQPGWVEVTVRDHGPGVAVADQERIFERFQRGPSASDQGGLGLGLWIARRLTQEMGGQVRVQSQPGEGAAFTVSLPVLSTEAPPALAHGPAP